MDSRILTAVKTLAVALMGEGTVEGLTEESIAAALENIATNYERPAVVTAVVLEANVSGVITGGTVTLSDESTITITVNTAT